jgi:hypothetical protein
VLRHHVVLPLPLLERGERHAVLAATNALLMGSISAEDANGCPRWCRKNAATPLSYCSCGT